MSNFTASSLPGFYFSNNPQTVFSRILFPLPDKADEGLDVIMELTAGLTQQETDRRAATTRREQVRDLIQQTSKYDGSTTPSVRMWIKEIALAFHLAATQEQIEIVSKTITGPLRFEIERLISMFVAAQNVERNAVPWNAIKHHVKTQFLNVDEATALRDEVERLRQSPPEPAAGYSGRFREIADAADTDPR